MLVGLVLAYVSTAVFGIPLVAYFDHRGVREWYMYILGGTACSLPTVLLYAFAHRCQTTFSRSELSLYSEC